MSTVQQRQELIVEWVRRNGETTVQRLSEIFSVSAMTIRRDLESLARSGRLQRVRGGARPLPPERTKPAPQSPSPLPADSQRFAFLDRLDAVVLNPMDPYMARQLVSESARCGLPLILESVPLPGVYPVVAIDSYQAGVSLGRWIGQYVQTRWQGLAHVLEIGMPEYEDTAERSRGLADGLQETAPQAQLVLSINGKGIREESREVAAAALVVYPQINVIVGVNDQSALGALDAIRQVGKDPQDVLVATFGLEGETSRRELLEDPSWIVGVAMFPELVGRTTVDVAVKAFREEALPRQIVTPTDIVTRESIGRYYSHENGQRSIAEAVQALLARSKASEVMLDLSPELPLPRRIGFIRYLHDDYYANLLDGFKERCAQLGIAAQIIDASADWAESVSIARRQIATVAANLIRDGESVILDAGTTCAHIAEQLRDRHGLTVITHSIPVINALNGARELTVICAGGVLDRASQSFLPTIARSAKSPWRTSRRSRRFSGW
jgi:ribose transport system substrate-binding protein